MLRSFLIYLSKADWAKQIITNWGFAWRMASRFIAGETLSDAMNVIGVLNSKHINATVDHLGEHTSNAIEAEKATDAIIDVINQISSAQLRSNVSIKLTQIGLSIDEGLCSKNLVRIMNCVEGNGNFLRLDMEDSSCVDSTLHLYRVMRDQNGFHNLGLVIQSYLYRSEQDIDELMQMGTRIRLCKGAYKEPPEVAFPRKSDVDRQYDLLAVKLLDAAKRMSSPLISPDGRKPPICAFATHDPDRIDFIKNYSTRIGLPKKALEFQMLYGIRRDLQENIQEEGYPVRIYVPFGTQWYPYFVRRLAERPANLWFFLTNFVRK
jgi:proline dehydrogenase